MEVILDSARRQYYIWVFSAIVLTILCFNLNSTYLTIEYISTKQSEIQEKFDAEKVKKQDAEADKESALKDIQSLGQKEQERLSKLAESRKKKKEFTEKKENLENALELYYVKNDYSKTKIDPSKYESGKYFQFYSNKTSQLRIMIKNRDQLLKNILDAHKFTSKPLNEINRKIYENYKNNEKDQKKYDTVKFNLESVKKGLSLHQALYLLKTHYQTKIEQFENEITANSKTTNKKSKELDKKKTESQKAIDQSNDDFQKLKSKNEKLIGRLEKLQKELQYQNDAVGIPLIVQQIPLWGPPIITVLLLWFYTGITKIAKMASDSSNITEYPWLMLYRDTLSKRLFYVTLALPVVVFICSAYLTYKQGMTYTQFDVDMYAPPQWLQALVIVFVYLWTIPALLLIRATVKTRKAILERHTKLNNW